MVARLIKLFIAAGLLCIGGGALASEALPDPTKPAVEIPYELEDGKTSAIEAAPLPKKAGLQSVILSPQHSAAVINGETIPLGGKIGDATLMEVRESSVVLQGPEGKVVMELFPGVHLNKTEVAAQDKENLPSIKIKKETRHKVAGKKKKPSEPVSSGQDKEYEEK